MFGVNGANPWFRSRRCAESSPLLRLVHNPTMPTMTFEDRVAIVTGAGGVLGVIPGEVVNGVASGNR